MFAAKLLFGLAILNLLFLAGELAFNVLSLIL